MKRAAPILVLLLFFAACAKKDNPVAPRVVIIDSVIRFVPFVDDPPSEVFTDELIRLSGKNLKRANLISASIGAPCAIVSIEDTLLTLSPPKIAVEDALVLRFMDTMITKGPVKVKSLPTIGSFVKSVSRGGITLIQGQDTVYREVTHVAFEQPRNDWMLLDSTNNVLNYAIHLDEGGEHNRIYYDRHIYTIDLAKVSYQFDGHRILAHGEGLALDIGLKEVTIGTQRIYFDGGGGWIGPHVLIHPTDSIVMHIELR